MTTTIESLLGVQWNGEHEARLEFGRELHGAFGGAFGGLLAAAGVLLARSVAPGRVPAGIDCRFLRGLPAGPARGAVTVVHAGRSLTCARVDIHDGSDRVATTATVSLIDPAALHPLDVTGASSSSIPSSTRWRSWQGLPGVEIPIASTLAPRLAPLEPNTIAAAVRVPWHDEDGEHSAEAACVAGDFCVGPPVAAACEGAWLPHPNPDVSLRFAPLATASETVTEVVGVGRLVRIVGGLALVAIEVHAAGVQYAAGCSTSMVLRGEKA